MTKKKLEIIALCKADIDDQHTNEVIKMMKNVNIHLFLFFFLDLVILIPIYFLNHLQVILQVIYSVSPYLLPFRLLSQYIMDV